MPGTRNQALYGSRRFGVESVEVMRENELSQASEIDLNPQKGEKNRKSKPLARHLFLDVPEIFKAIDQRLKR